MAESNRFALYYAPEAEDPLWAAGNRWLGRDPVTGAGFPLPEGVAPELVAEAAGYGFHATLKPPFRLAEGESRESLAVAVAALAAGIAPFDLPPLAIADLGGFLALRETTPSLSLQALGDLLVAGLDRFRAPASEAERARRRARGLSSAEEVMLDLWCYPHVFALWRFHMTLTRRLEPVERPAVTALAEAHFGTAPALSRVVESVALYEQAGPGAPFLLVRRFPLRG